MKREKTLIESNKKPSIIEHLNEEHQDELIGFATLYLQGDMSNSAIEQVTILDIYQQGVELQVSLTTSEETTVFIEFPTHITSMEGLKPQYIALMQKSAKLQGKDSIKLIEQKFKVVETLSVTENMLRLVLSAPKKTPINYAGYAYLFDLKNNDTPIDVTAKRQQCYYTLRKAWQKIDSNNMTAWIDIYLHGDTPAGNWARTLQVGNSITSQREFPEKVEHLASGQALLIADETSLPTVARLLELWDNPIAPIIVAITNKQADQEYLKDVEVSDSFRNQVTILPLVIDNNQEELASNIDSTVADFICNNPVKIDKVWGAMEAKTTKKLRRLLKDRLGLSRTDCVLKVYWRNDEDMP